MEQGKMKSQLYARDITMLHCLKYYIDSDLEETCLSNAAG